MTDTPDDREPEPDHTVTGALHESAWPRFLEFLLPMDLETVAEIG